VRQDKFEVTLTVEDNKTCTVAAGTVDFGSRLLTLKGLTPEQATHAKEILERAYQRGKYAAATQITELLSDNRETLSLAAFG
jgi:hypothetical protein